MAVGVSDVTILLGIVKKKKKKSAETHLFAKCFAKSSSICSISADGSKADGCVKAVVWSTECALSFTPKSYIDLSC